MAKRQVNVRQLIKFIKVSKTDEQKDLITQVIDTYSSGKIHKVITAENMIKKILNTKSSRESVVKQLPKLEIKEPVNKIVYKSETKQNKPDKQNKLNELITIKEQPCALDGLSCIELPNVEVLDKLLNSEGVLQTVANTSKDFFGSPKPRYENERKHIEEYRSKVDRDGKIQTKYKKFNYMKYGRVYCLYYLGAIVLRKEIRGAIFGDKYVDLDMCNCHPNIYYQIAKLYDILCPCLEKYILNRDAVLSTIMAYYNVDRYTAKSLFIRLLYLGGFKSWATDNDITKDELPFIKKIRKELKLIAEKIISNNPYLVEKVKANLKRKNKPFNDHKLKCCVVSYFNQEIECRILEQLYLHCVSKGYIKDDVCSLCYDGIMILKEHYNESILNEFSKVILETCGLTVKFEEKEMDTSILKDLDAHVKVQENVLTIDQRYLLDKDKLLNDETPFVQHVKHFLDDQQCKSLNIKSPYDTGKTQLLKSILRDYPQFKKVLMVTYRITLAYEFESVFSEFDFANYKNGDFTGDHLINQTESLLRLTDETNVLPKYDLIIMDEIESVLNQFNSPTFKGKASNTFELLVALCKNPTTKIISLDGDMADRSFTFIEYFNNALTIKNTCNFNNKTLNMYMVTKEELRAFETKLMTDLGNNLKLVIPSMSATYGYELLKSINEKFPDKKVLIYTSTTSDNEKQDIKGIVDLWSSADVVIYTPTIEAGVSFDVAGHFDKLYGYMCGGSCAQRSYLQMLSRVRKFNTTEFNLYSNIPLDESGKVWTYEELDENSLYSKDLVLKNEYIYDDVLQQTFIVKKNELYRQIYIHNLVEEKNKHQKVFMKVFFELANKKGYLINMINSNKQKQDEQESDKKLLTKYTEILDAVDINESTYNEYCLFQKKGRAMKEEKLAIQKYLIKLMLAVDNLNYHDDESKFKVYTIVKKYVNHSTTFKNLIALIDDANNKDKDELQILARKQLIGYVRDIINKLGFKHCCDTAKFNEDDFTTNCKSACALLSDLSKNSLFNQICNTSKDDLNFLQQKDLSAQMRRINTILNKCGIKVSNVGKDKDKDTRKNIKEYKLEFIDDLDEVLSNKMTYQHYKLTDTLNIFQKVELNQFQSYITKSPTNNQIDTSGLDDFID